MPKQQEPAMRMYLVVIHGAAYQVTHDAYRLITRAATAAEAEELTAQHGELCTEIFLFNLDSITDRS